MKSLSTIDLSKSAATCAQRLLGCELVRIVDGKSMRAKIVETEAYAQNDAASHSFRGMTPRTQIMFGPAGFAYVYFTYGMHYCFNIVTGKEGEGSAVLIRALEPLEGIEYMQQNRPAEIMQLTSGPAKLCQALGIDRTLNGHDMRTPPLQLIAKHPLSPKHIVATTRIGISQDTHRIWRFYIKDNPLVSRLSKQ